MVRRDKTILIDNLVKNEDDIVDILDAGKWKGTDLFTENFLEPGTFLHKHNGIIYAISLISTRNEVLYLDDFEVNKKLRGKGFGKLAFLEIVTKTLKANMKEIRLRSMSTSSDKFYRKIGMYEWKDNTFTMGKPSMTKYVKSMTKEKINDILYWIG